ncbi:MAG TPA: hypothetical protein VLF88_02860 [Candidatus Babeliales bacterium]|nr:hypothetical protein [Candidatus Babeliales bacterium]
MKATNFFKYVILPVAALAAGIKLGIKYAQGTYVSKDRKFIEAEISKRERQKNG